MGCGDCGSCGNSGSCGGGCGGGELFLTEPELALLRRLGETAFLPAAAGWDMKKPVYREEQAYPEELYSAALLGLAAKGLVRLDYDMPLKNFGYRAYEDCPLHGSAALTGRGRMSWTRSRSRESESETMANQFSRTELLLGREGMERLTQAHVAVFGLGGVGGYVAEALVRGGIGTLDLIDSDRVSPTNLNRQILATHGTLGRFKADVARERALAINPEAVVNARRVFYGPDTAGDFDFSQYDYVVDAIDTVTGKLNLIQRSQAAGARIISCMGTGNKLDPTAFRVADIYETSVCPLARVMRKELKRRGVRHLKVVYSQEPPMEPSGALYQEALAGEVRRQVPGSVSFVPAAAGLILAGEVIKDLLFLERKRRQKEL